MKHERVPDRQDKRQEGRTPLLEWIAASVGFVLTLTMLGFIGWQAWKDPEDKPPSVAVHLQRIVPAAGGWVAEFTAVNQSPATAAAVQIEGELLDGARVVATSQATLDYVPGDSERRGGLFFRDDPGSHQLVLRALGYAEP